MEAGAVVASDGRRKGLLFSRIGFDEVDVELGEGEGDAGRLGEFGVEFLIEIEIHAPVVGAFHPHTG